jgi:hypothetical protein
MSSSPVGSGLDLVDSRPDTSLIASVATNRLESAPYTSSSTNLINPNEKIQFYRILDNVTGSNDASTSIRCLETLEKIIGNMLKHPEEEKYSRVKMNNSVIKNSLIQIRGGGIDFLLKAGFLRIV